MTFLAKIALYSIKGKNAKVINIVTLLITHHREVFAEYLLIDEYFKIFDILNNFALISAYSFIT